MTDHPDYPLINMPRLRRLLDESGFDAVLAVAPETVAYTSGFYDSHLRTLRERMHCTISPCAGEPGFVVPAPPPRSRSRWETSFITDVREYGRGAPPFIAVLADMLKARGLLRGRLGIEMGQWPARHFLDLQEALPEATFVDGTRVLDEARAVKTEAEIELLTHAGRQTEKAIQIAFSLAQAGRPLKDVADTMGCAVMRLGADIVAFNDIYTGWEEGTRGGHADPAKILERGDMILVDFGALFSGYYSDLARMAVVGPPTDRQRDRYQRVRDVQQAIIASMRPGVTCAEVYEAAAAGFRRVGLRWLWDEVEEGEVRRRFYTCGHSVGLGLHEYPLLTPIEERVLEPDMVFYVEPIYRDVGEQKYQIEDLVRITGQGAEVLTGSMDTRLPYVID
ncbi:MAG: aminopeptidase P family protein [Armatimonadetes bacterium]|nr:aminopeptidase P family protein [Armatimonadota bacterium]